MEKELQKRLEDFTDERFIYHIKNMVNLGMASSQGQEALDTISFINDLYDLVTEAKTLKTN